MRRDETRNRDEISTHPQSPKSGKLVRILSENTVGDNLGLEEVLKKRFEFLETSKRRSESGWLNFFDASKRGKETRG